MIGACSVRSFVSAAGLSARSAQTAPAEPGTTRLAVEVAHWVVRAFTVTCFVPLASLTDSAFVAPVVAQALGVPAADAEPLLDQLAGVIDQQPALIVLDNCEHLLPGARSIAALIARCPHLRLLATSRAPLEVYGEQRFVVPPLSVPEEHREHTPATLAHVEAIRLFTDRARQGCPGLQLTAATAPAIAAICRRLDGLPLAIELAAGWSATLTPAQILRRLTPRLALLRNGPVDLPARQRTMQAALDWSFALLTEADRRVFLALSVFVGGFSWESAEAVCSSLPEPPTSLLDSINSLLEKSLLSRETWSSWSGVAQVRYGMLEMIREYAGERLRTLPEAAAVADAHAGYFARLATTVEALTGRQQLLAIDQVEADQENLGVALRWWIAQERLDTGMNIARLLFHFWRDRGYPADGFRRLQALLTPAADAPVALQATLRLWLAGLAQQEGEIRTARRYWREALALYRQVEDQLLLANALSDLGMLLREAGHFRRAWVLVARSLAIYQVHCMQREIALQTDRLGTIAVFLERFEEAQRLFEENLTVWRGLGDRWGIAWSLHNLGALALIRGDASTALPLLLEGLTLRRDLQLWQETVGSLAALAGVAAALGPWEPAARMAGAVAALAARRKLHVPLLDRTIVERAVAEARRHLDAPTYGEAWAGGQAMPLEHALDYAQTASDSHGGEQARR